MSSIRETAEKAVDNVFRRGILLNTHRIALIVEIEQALRNERERAAKIAETLYDHKVFDVDAILRQEIAAAIRKDD